MTNVFRIQDRKPETFADCIFHYGPANQVVLRGRRPDDIGPYKYATAYAPGMVWFYTAIQDEADLVSHTGSNDEPSEWYWKEQKAIPAEARMTNIHFNPWGDYECALNDLIRYMEKTGVTSIDDLDQSGIAALWSNSPWVEVLLGNHEVSYDWEEKMWSLMSAPEAADLLQAIIDRYTRTIYDLLNDITILSRPRPITGDQMTQLNPLLHRYNANEVQKIYGDPTYRAWFETMDELRALKEQFDLEKGRYAGFLDHPIFQQMIEGTRSKENFELCFQHGTHTFWHDGLEITRENFRTHIRYRTLDELKEYDEQARSNWLDLNTIPYSESDFSLYRKLGLVAYILIPEPIEVYSI